MKLVFEIVSDRDSKGTKEYAVIVRGQFPITQYKRICDIEDGLISIVNKAVKAKRKSRQKQKVRMK